MKSPLAFEIVVECGVGDTNAAVDLYMNELRSLYVQRLGAKGWLLSVSQLIFKYRDSYPYFDSTNNVGSYGDTRGEENRVFGVSVPTGSREELHALLKDSFTNKVPFVVDMEEDYSPFVQFYSPHSLFRILSYVSLGFTIIGAMDLLRIVRNYFISNGRKFPRNFNAFTLGINLVNVLIGTLTSIDSNGFLGIIPYVFARPLFSLQLSLSVCSMLCTTFSWMNRLDVIGKSVQMQLVTNPHHYYKNGLLFFLLVISAVDVYFSVVEIYGKWGASSAFLVPGYIYIVCYVGIVSSIAKLSWGIRSMATKLKGKIQLASSEETEVGATLPTFPMWRFLRCLMVLRSGERIVPHDGKASVVSSVAGSSSSSAHDPVPPHSMGGNSALKHGHIHNLSAPHLDAIGEAGEVTENLSHTYGKMVTKEEDPIQTTKTADETRGDTKAGKTAPQSVPDVIDQYNGPLRGPLPVGSDLLKSQPAYSSGPTALRSSISQPPSTSPRRSITARPPLAPSLSQQMKGKSRLDETYIRVVNNLESSMLYMIMNGFLNLLSVALALFFVLGANLWRKDSTLFSLTYPGGTLLVRLTSIVEVRTLETLLIKISDKGTSTSATTGGDGQRGVRKSVLISTAQSSRKPTMEKSKARESNQFSIS
jgi:hypothetical protein